MHLEHAKRYVTKDGTITTQLLWDKTTGTFQGRYDKYDCQWHKNGECVSVIGVLNGFVFTNVDIDREATEEEIKEQFIKEGAKALGEPSYAYVVKSCHPDLKLLLDTLNLDSKQKQLAQVGTNLVATLIRKNTDYGSSVFDSPLLCPNMPAKSSILVRMSDKIKRLVQLQSNEAMVKESYEDTMRDLAGYAILYLSTPEDKNEQQEKAV